MAVINALIGIRGIDTIGPSGTWGTYMARRTIVDAHHHLWDIRANAYPWLSGPPFAPSVAGDVGPIAHNYLLADLKADAADYDLRKSVHVDAGCADPLAETKWVQAISDTAGLPIAIVAGVRLHARDVAEQLAAHAAFPNVRGIRHILNWDPDPALTYTDRFDLMADPDWLRGFGLLRHYDMSFDLQVYPWQLTAAADLAARFPDTPIILNHAGMPLHQSGTGRETWRAGIKRLASNVNAFAKISGLGMVDWAWTVESIRPFVLETIESFGVDRCMFASNFPVDRLYSSFSTLYQAYELIISGLPENDQHKLLAANAERIYRF